MQISTVLVLACMVAVVVAQEAGKAQPVEQTLQESLFETPAHESSPRDKRGLLLLKKKLLLGALGLKAAKVGAAAGVVGAIALKSKPNPHPALSVDVDLHHRWW